MNPVKFTEMNLSSEMQRANRPRVIAAGRSIPVRDIAIVGSAVVAGGIVNTRGG